MTFHRVGGHQWRCARCGAKRNLLGVEHVRRCSAWHAERIGATHIVSLRLTCVDVGACRARLSKRRERARVRGSKLVIVEPKLPDAPKGTCRWCGEPIELVGPGAARRRSRAYHYGDEHETGDRDCRREFDESFTWDARIAIQRRGDLLCVDCGDGGWDWEADHEVPLEDGGDHSMENLVRRCRDCHREKTAREAAERARRRRVG